MSRRLNRFETWVMTRWGFCVVCWRREGFCPGPYTNVYCAGCLARYTPNPFGVDLEDTPMPESTPRG